jgi:DNA helicase II / ATP-dependent DNA helicase PcrA
VEHLLQSLNEAQSHAVQETQGPSMILAGPGSGKTRVLTHRIAWLIENGVDPFRILALTFTKKAAGEMKERIMKLSGNQSRDVWMGTFHSVFAKILRIEAARLGYQSNFTIYDTDDSKSVIKQILRENNIDEKNYNPSYVLHRMSGAKMSLLNPQEYNNNSDIQAEDFKAQKPLLGHIYTLYWNRCRRSNAMDFEDILYNMNLLLRDFPDLKQKYQNKFHYILVDEYQDTCFSQYVILKKLAQEHRNICVVGDDAQGIYAFRGARIENILNFSRDFPEATVVKLEQNYRSSKVIVNAANSVIAHNQAQLAKTIWTENDEGEKIKVIRNLSDSEESINVVQDIFHTKMNNQCMNSDFAVLYRTNAQSRSLEESFRKMNIPYKVFGSVSFYKRKEIKDIMAYFRLAVNQTDEEALTRIINVPARGIGKTSIDRLIVYAHENDSNLWDTVQNIMNISSKIGINQGAARKIDDFSVLIKSFVARLESVSAYDIAEIILKESGYLNFLKSSDEPESAMRIENIEELMNGIRDYSERANEENSEETTTLADFLMEVSLLTDLEENDENTDRVSLMTVHSAKGLEFPYVYITGLEENLFPSVMSMNSRSEVEEERRLFYVAVTRAMRRVTLSYAESRFRWGKREFCEPSRFLEEIDEQLLDMPGKKETPNWNTERKMYFDSELEMKPELRFTPSFAKKDIKPKQPTAPQGFKKIEKQQETQPTILTEQNMNLIVAGTDVEHEKFGKGKVLQVDGQGNEKKAMVFFPAVGKKNLLLKFAKLKIL